MSVSLSLDYFELDVFTSISLSVSVFASDVFLSLSLLLSDSTFSN